MIDVTLVLAVVLGVLLHIAVSVFLRSNNLKNYLRRRTSNDVTLVTPKEMHKISIRVTNECQRPLARELGLSEENIQEIENNCSLHKCGDVEFTYEILDEWKERNGNEATRNVLMKALLAVGSNDVVDEVFTNRTKTSQTFFSEERKSQNNIEDVASSLNQNISVGNTQISESSSVEETKELINIEEICSTSEESSLNGTIETSEQTKILCEVEEISSIVDKPASIDECVTQQEINKLSMKIRTEQVRLLARELGVIDSKVDEIEVNCKLNKHGDTEIVYSILRIWKETKGKAATRQVLKNALIVIDRTDLTDEIFSDLSETRHRGKIKRNSKDIQRQIEDNQVKVYKEVGLPQVNWTDRILPLEELYVELELFNMADDCESNGGEPMQLEELFSPIDGIDPVRILIEGGPGYGKTTFCCKLINDWGRNACYIRSKFKMVFLFELRYFKENDSVEEMLKSECEEIGVNADDGIDCIETFEKETLLILDGFDELNDEGKQKILPLILKEKYSSMFVIVTSRRGMFATEKERAMREGGIVKKTREDVNVKQLWNKKVLIRGVARDKIETFLRKYFLSDFRDFELKVKSIIRREMVEVFECPLFLILLAMLFEEKTLENINSKTSLYKDFFNFLFRRNLFRENKILAEEEVDIFDQSSDHSELIRSLNQFGQLATEYLCENKLMFEEKKVLKCCKDRMIFHLGFLMKVPKLAGRRKETFYQPIHKSFLEFVAAFAIWNLFKRDENQFKQEMERIRNKGLKPTNDSLFYVFLGGFMDNNAHVLFESLTRYALWFNMESICFTNILSEIQDIHSFFPSFQPMLDSFIPSFYSSEWNKWLMRDYFKPDLRPLILKHVSDGQLINVLEYNSQFCLNLPLELHVEDLVIVIKEDSFKIYSNEDKQSIRCKNLTCMFYTRYLTIDNWSKFVSFVNSFQNETIHFYCILNQFNSNIFTLLYMELIDGEWKQKNIDRLRFNMDEYDCRQSVSLLADLVKRNRIKEGVYLEIYKRTKEEENNFFQKEMEELLNAIMQSTTIKEFVICNDESNFSLDINFSRELNPHLKSFYFQGSLNVFNAGVKGKNYSFEEVRVDLTDEGMELDFIQSLQDVRFLECNLTCFNALIEMEWPGLKKIEELELKVPHIERFQTLNTVSQFKYLQVLKLDFRLIETIPSNSHLPLINFFSSLNLRICQFVKIENVELFSFITEVLMEGLKRKERVENNSAVDSDERKKFQLQELIFDYDLFVRNFEQIKGCNGIQSIHSMLQNKLLQQCCWVNRYYNTNMTTRSKQFETLFPSSDRHRICCEMDGMNPNSSHWSQFNYRWFSLFDRFCIKFIDEI